MHGERPFGRPLGTGLILLQTQIAPGTGPISQFPELQVRENGWEEIDPTAPLMITSTLLLKIGISKNPTMPQVPSQLSS